MGITNMKINNLGYLLKEGVRGIFLRGFMSFAAVCVTVACLLIVGSFFSLTYNVNLMVEDLNKTNEVLVYIDSELPDAEAKSVGTKINTLDNVLKATFITREQALTEFVAGHEGDDAFTGVEASYLRHRFLVTLEDNDLIETTVEQLSQIPGVAKVTASVELARNFASMQRVLQVVSIGIIAVLLVVSLLIISNTVKLVMYDRQDEIAIMKMVGATNGFIRIPFMVEGMILGMVGAGIAFGLEWGLYNALLQKIQEVRILHFVPFTELLVPMIATFGLAGLFVGFVGSWTSIRKFLDV